MARNVTAIYSLSADIPGYKASKLRTRSATITEVDDIPNIPNVGDTVYIIYAGLVTVQSANSIGDITFYMYDNERLHKAARPLYRTMDCIGSVRHHTVNNDYTTEVITNEQTET